METVISAPNRIGLPSSLISGSILETLAFLMIIVILFLLFSSPRRGLNHSAANATETARASSENSVSPEPTHLTDPLSGLENIECEEHEVTAQKRGTPATNNPIDVLINIED
jgi:hypothetical protein